jgi:hypothetical protein
MPDVRNSLIPLSASKTFLVSYLFDDSIDGTVTSRNQPKCNHSIYDYMQFVVVCNWIWEHL